MKQLNLTSNGITVNLSLRNATVGDNMRRSLLAAQALQNPQPDPAEQTVAVVIYPRCLGCLVAGEIDGQPARELTPAGFLALPFEIGEAWLNAALELNPGWNLATPTAEQQTSAEKKD